jgi:hypothetical protein
MIRFYYDVILGLQFWTFKKPPNPVSKKMNNKDYEYKLKQ